MSHSSKSFDDCSDVVQRVWAFLDSELDDASAEAIRQHLSACEGCLDRFDVDQAFKSLLHRSCGGDVAPSHLRDKIVAQLTTDRHTL
jgi:mycothiol system anti-sigma-R factor